MAKEFTPTKEMLTAAENLFKARAYVETIRPIVLQYQKEILAEGQWHISPKKASRRGDAVIVEPKDSWLMSDDDFAVYHARCKAARDKAKLHVENDGHCPLLVAEHLVTSAEHALIDAMADTTGVTKDKLLSAKMDICLVDYYKNYIHLTLQLLAPFVRSSDELMKEISGDASPNPMG